MKIWFRSLTSCASPCAWRFSTHACDGHRRQPLGLQSAYDTAGTLNEEGTCTFARRILRGMWPWMRRRVRGLSCPPIIITYPVDIVGHLCGAFPGWTRHRRAAPSSFGELVAGVGPVPTDDASFFRLKSVGAASQDYYGLSIALSSPAGLVWVSVARAAEANMLVHALLGEFVRDLAWVIPLFVAAILITGVYVIRSGLKPVRDVSAMAATIGPNVATSPGNAPKIRHHRDELSRPAAGA